MCKQLHNGSRSYTRCGSNKYMAPELVKGTLRHGHGFSVDYWALGVVIYLLATNEFPFIGKSGKDSVHEVILQGKYTYPYYSRVSAKVKSLIKKLLSMEEQDRERGIWQHELFQDLNRDAILARSHPAPYTPLVSYP